MSATQRAVLEPHTAKFDTMKIRPSVVVPWTLVVLSLGLSLPVNGLRGSSEIEPPTGERELRDRLFRLERENEELRAALTRLDALQERVQELSAVADEARAQAGRAARSVHRYELPSEVSFCGERIPLEDASVRRRFEDEWLRFLVNRHWLMSWSRRAREAFPTVERLLAEAELPDDLKYVMVIESGVEARAVSSAGAVGWWQFVQGTGARYGLARAGHLDERRDLEEATRAAIRYLGEMHEEFGSWPLSLAGYNAGENRVRDAIEEQGTRDYYEMVLPRETEAYWFKAAAVKVLLSDPSRYDLALPDDGWAPVLCDTLRLEVSRARLDLKDLAAQAEISYRELKELNPWFRRSWVPHGEHKLVLPRPSVARVLRENEGAVVVAEGREPESAEPSSPSSLELAPSSSIEPGPERP